MRSFPGRRGRPPSSGPAAAPSPGRSAGEAERAVDPLAAPALLAAHAALRAARELDYAVDPPGIPGPAAVEHLRRTILEGGEPLRRAALDALVGADDERRLLAGLVLQTAELTAAEIAWLRDNGNEVARLWFALSQYGSVELPAPRDVSTEADQDAARDLLNQCAPEFKAEFSRSNEELDGNEDGFVEAYLNTFVPNLERPGDHVNDLKARRADLDGDGIDDWLVLGSLQDGWFGTNFALVADGETRRALLIRELPGAFWSGRIAAYDALGGSHLEPFVHGAVLGGTVYGIALHLDPHTGGVRSWEGRSVPLLQLGEGEPIWIVKGEAYNYANSGTASLLTSTYGGEWVLSRTDAPSARVTLHTGRSPW